MTKTPNPRSLPPPCRDCHVDLEPGFMLDITEGGGSKVARWCSGEPVKAWIFSEVNGSQASSGIKTCTYRCPKCFRLESFALPPD